MRLEVFVPDEVLVRAGRDDLSRWEAQAQALLERGWTIERHDDFVRLGRWLRLTPPPAALTAREGHPGG